MDEDQRDDREREGSRQLSHEEFRRLLAGPHFDCPSPASSLDVALTYSNDDHVTWAELLDAATGRVRNPDGEGASE